MKNRKIVIPQNYLTRIPARADSVGWEAGEDGLVTLSVANTGWANRLAQAFFNRPKVSYIHLDRFGSFIWPLLDGKMDIIALGKLVEEHFGEESHPLYERLARYFQIMDSYHFIRWCGEEKASR
ncbi:MAG: PqqD family protein [Ruminococcaceae bacterium]|nr:PqqD family protein [Oscillospiraceae bacterium]